MELVHHEYQSVNHVEVSKVVGPSWLLFPENYVGILERSIDMSPPWSSGVQANLEGIHAIIRTVCTILQKI